MSEIYEAMSSTGGHPMLDHDLEAYRLATEAGDKALAAEIIKSATHVARQIRAGMLSTPNQGTDIKAHLAQPEDTQH